MRREPKKKRQIFQGIRLYIIIFLFLLALGLNSYAILRRALLRNAQELGTSLARSYASEERSNLTVYETLISFGTQNLDRQTDEEDWDTARRERWLQQYFKRIQAVLGEKRVDPYAVIDGRIVAANPWEGDATFDYAGTQWYQLALENEGEVIFTDVYTDSIYERPVITIAQKCRNTDVVIAFDVLPENFQFESDSLSLPADASFYLCDKKGTLIYAQTVLEGYSQESVQEYVSSVIEDIRNGTLEAYNSSIRDLENNLRAVYYNQMDNGWLVILTVPFDTVLQGLEQFRAAFFLIMAACLVAIILIAWRDWKLNEQIGRTNETVRVLGNSYYALYRVNCEEETYEMIKGSDYMRSRIEQRGSYQELLGAMGDVIEKDAYKEFLESFSAANIRKLVKNRVKDFGGDFRRLFENEYHWVNIRVLFDESLLPEEAVLCFREVDQEKKRQFEERQLLENALENARMSEKTKQAFFSNMSHDMRTPLNAIISLSELARGNAGDPEKLTGYLEKIRYSSRQLLELVNDILDMSRMEQGKVALNAQEFNLRQSMKEGTDAFRLQAETEKKIFVLSFDIQDEWVLGDAFRIGQVMNNLLSNAFKFTSEGDRITLAVRQFESRDYAQYQIVISDTGLGMSEEFLPHLFEPYARETRFSARQISGTGLGMPIVKNLVTQMGGEINVESRLGEGTTFTIAIPFPVVRREKRILEKAETEPDRQGEQEQPEEAKEEKKSPLEGKRVLLAEDNLINMEIATEILSMNGILVTQAENGEEALKAFEDSGPFFFDAILMDMQMPRMDGCEAARRIRALKRPDAGSVPIIAVTANAFAEDIAATSSAGMDAHISKPIDFSLLCRTLEKLTEKN